MKNIHILPTNKPSRLIIYSTLLNEFRLLDEPIEDWNHKKNIYITSDEEIKEGDWFLPQGHINPHKLKEYNKINGDLESYNGLCYDISKCKKIILTTDQDLIKDGVQAIDDEFLEWFVNNPSCEEVEVESKVTKDGVWTDLKGYVELPTIHSVSYKIIIPKEELINCEECGCDYTYEIGYGFRECFQCLNKWKNKIPKEEKDYTTLLQPVGTKQETLEEAAIRLYTDNIIKLGNETSYNAALLKRKDFIDGAKWQQERSYSEEEVDKLISDFKHDFRESTGNYIKQIFEGAIFGLERLKQLKNK